MASFGSYSLKAAKSPVSLLLLGGLGMISLVSGNIVPVLAALAAKALWVGAAPLLPAWRRAVDRREEEQGRLESENRAKQLLRQLPTADQQRYQLMMNTAVSIRENYARYNDASRTFLDQLSERLDDMMLRYLRMLIAQNSYTGHLAGNSVADVQRRIGQLEAEMGQDDERVRSVKAKQRDILLQRRDKLEKAEEDRNLLAAQLGTLEELIKLLKEQAITMKQPEEMNAQLDSLMGEIESTEQTVTALESSFDSYFDRELRAAEEEQQRLQKDNN